MAAVETVGELEGLSKVLGRIVGVQFALLVREEAVPALRRDTARGVIRPSETRTDSHVGLRVLGY